MATAGAAEGADHRRIAVPFRCVRFQPPYPIVGVLYGSRIWRFWRNRQIDGDDEKAARCQLLVHWSIGCAVLIVPCAAMHI
jgi:hypothetical protein